MRAEYAATHRGAVTAIQRHMESYGVSTQMHGLLRVGECRKALEALDRRGWERSFHQRLFHEVSIIICS